MVVLTKFEQRGWLVVLPGEPVELALQFFEALAQSIPTPRINAYATGKMHFTAIWAANVFNALASSDIGFWVPISFSAS